MATWVQDAKAKPEKSSILEYNAQQSFEVRRWRLQDDLDSKASRDSYYVSAFTDRPTQIWRGEPGVLILRNTVALDTPLTSETNKELREALEVYNELFDIWMDSDKPCSVDRCRGCSYKRDDEMDKDKCGKEHEEHGENERYGENKEKDEEDWKDEEDERDQPRSKTRKAARQNRLIRTRSSQSHQYHVRQPFSLESRSTNCSRHSKASTIRHAARKKTKVNRQKKSTPYDESVPYSHREGYTFANSTANELMEMWQSYRKNL